MVKGLSHALTVRTRARNAASSSKNDFTIAGLINMFAQPARLNESALIVVP